MNNLKRRPSDDNEEEDDGSGADDSMQYRLAFHAFKLEEDIIKPKKKMGKKLSRNESEKLRRDRLNMYIAELARLVPMIMSTDRKMDKSSILRLTVAYLRIHHDLSRNVESGNKSWRPDFLNYESLGSMLLESLGGFMLVIDKKGLLIYASESIKDSLGHNLVDILGCDLAKIIHPEDVGIVQKQFEDDSLLREEALNEACTDTSVKEEDDKDSGLYGLDHMNGHHNNITTSDDHSCDQALLEREEPMREPESKEPVVENPQRTFCLRMLNIKNRNTTKYENVQITGLTKVVPPLHGGADKSNPSSRDVCLIGVAKVMKPETINELVPILPTSTSANQWITRHNMDGKITYSDQRAALLTGFMPGESIGLSPYALTHPDDISSLVSVHNMFLKTGNIPQTIFRMFTKARDTLYVTTNTHMAVDMWTQKPKYIISINEVVSDEEGQELLVAQSNRIKALECATEQLSLEEKERNGGVSESENEADDTYSAVSRTSIATSGQMSVASDGSVVIIPDMVKHGEDKIDVVVGEQRYQINLRNQKEFKSKNKTSLNKKNIFDMHCHLDEKTDVPLRKPDFLGVVEVDSVLGSPGGMSIGQSDSVFQSDTEMDIAASLKGTVGANIPHTTMNQNGQCHSIHQTQLSMGVPYTNQGINNNTNGSKVSSLPSPQGGSTKNNYPIPRPYMSPEEIKKIQDWLQLVNTDHVVSSTQDGSEANHIQDMVPGGSPPSDFDDHNQVLSPDTTQEKPMLSIQKKLARQLWVKHNDLQKSIETQTAELANLRKQMETNERKMLSPEALVQARILRVQELEEKLTEQKQILLALKQEYLRCVEPIENQTATQYSNISSATSPCPMPLPDSSTFPLPVRHQTYRSETVTSPSTNLNSSMSPKLPMGQDFTCRMPMKMEPQSLDPSSQMQQHYLHQQQQQQIQQQQLLQSWNYPNRNIDSRGGGEGGGGDNGMVVPMTSTVTNTGDVYNQGLLHQMPNFNDKYHMVKQTHLGQQAQQPDMNSVYPTGQQNGSHSKFHNYDSNGILPVDGSAGIQQGAYFNGQNEYHLEEQFVNSANGQQDMHQLPELLDLDFEDRPVTMADFPFLSS